MLEINQLTKHFSQGWLRKTTTYAVQDVSFTIPAGKTFGLMGTSGSGKSTVAKLITGLLRPTAGEIRYQGSKLTGLSRSGWQPFRRKIQLIFQQPTLSLDPRQTMLDAMLEPLLAHKLISSRRQGLDKIEQLLTLTQLSAEILPKYSWQISGGQAQRIAIARVLGLEPEVIIADEPTAMLDLSVQAQILTLLKDIQQQVSLSLLLISHDPDVVKACADQAAFMISGKIAAAGHPADILPQSGSLLALRRSILPQCKGGLP
ncbi:putative oligopeptide transport ATP-binding protein YkfD [uncultured Sporomusa sp.]|uniref:Putative oligopeptide transport ATP-binding protein YkfD n=1 Tax=uncultured Sporomusa sp. TaxID=307249 RepID=A0A212M0D6_9FIRM|nr:dipeptide/oligopeptide/nickel ABC transporter ATP-binding protein [uncultured Sporomusa sp.]SCM83253.1 putative oligopeptide transport ATP-binding protein YkfD [uncultured Sporomusa sp.]